MGETRNDESLELARLAESVLTDMYPGRNTPYHVQVEIVNAADYPAHSVGHPRCPTDGRPASVELPAETAFRKLSVLMPIYNERWTLAKIVARVLSSPVPLQIESHRCPPRSSSVLPLTNEAGPVGRRRSSPVAGESPGNLPHQRAISP